MKWHYTKNHLNIDKVLLVIVVVLLIISSIILITNIVKRKKIKIANDLLHQEQQQIEQNRIINEKIKNEEEKRLQEEKLKKRYEALSNEDIKKIDDIYDHQDNKRVFLTFDDGPTTQVTPFILDLLKLENIKANFFVLGSRAEENPELVKREYEEGHFIGNHSYSHRYSQIYKEMDTVFQEYDKTEKIIKSAVGNENFRTLLFRFPGGLNGGPYNDIKQETTERLKQCGVTNVDWNALTNDADGANTKEAILENFHNTIEDKTSIVLLMHDAPDKILTYETLPDIIKYLRDNNYSFKTFYDALDR